MSRADWMLAKVTCLSAGVVVVAANVGVCMCVSRMNACACVYVCVCVHTYTYTNNAYCRKRQQTRHQMCQFTFITLALSLRTLAHPRQHTLGLTSLHEPPPHRASIATRRALVKAASLATPTCSNTAGLAADLKPGRRADKCVSECVYKSVSLRVSV
jgi:hypothetical protein